jgi:SulP family sulfate permease
MSGFIFVTALLIVLGQYKDLVGYASSLETNKLFKAVDISLHAGSWNIPTVFLGVGAIIVLLLLKRSPLRKWADIAILLLATLFAVLSGWQEVELVGDISSVPSGLAALPRPVLPDLSLVPALLGGAVAAVVVGLAESSGAGAAYPNPDGSRSDMSGDFIGQGLGNFAGSFFQAMPAGGSLSRTGLNASSGARSRWSGVYSGMLIAITLVLFGRYAELIPMSGLAALLIVIGFEMMLKQGRELREAWQISRLNTVVAILVIVFGVFTDLTRAIFAGVFLSLLLYAFVSANQIKVVMLRQRDRGEWEESSLPEDIPSDQATVIQLRGNAYFASVYSFDELLPTPEDFSNAVIVLRARERNIASLTGLNWFEQYAVKLRESGNLFMISDVEPELMETLEKTESVQVIGEENIFLEEPGVFASTEKALSAAQAWIEKK